MRTPDKFLAASLVRGWRNSFRYRGRTSRCEYSRFLGWNLVITIAVVGAWLAGWMSVVFPLIYVFAAIFPMIAISIRRLNDINQPWTQILNREALNQPGPTDQELSESERLILEELPFFTWKQFPDFLFKVLKVTTKVLAFILLVLTALFPFDPNLPMALMISAMIVAILAVIALPHFTTISEDFAKARSARSMLSKKFNQCFPQVEKDLLLKSSYGGNGYRFYAGKSKASRGEFSCLGSDGTKNTVFISIPEDEDLASYFIDRSKGASCSDGLGCSDGKWPSPTGSD